jgi:hypothetical protein
MCLRKYVDDKTSDIDVRRQFEDAIIQDWCLARQPEEAEPLARALIKKQDREDRSLFYRLLWWYYYKFIYQKDEFDTAGKSDAEDVPF